MAKILSVAGVVVLLLLSMSSVSHGSCCYADSPDCSCFIDGGVWDPSGVWIQDIALATVGTQASCVSDGGKPFYQMRLGIDSKSAAMAIACIFEAISSVGTIPYDREAWCSEAISYWHSEAGIPYRSGYRNSSRYIADSSKIVWGLDWQLPNTEAIRTFYMVDERGRWINWDDVDYLDFKPGINAPAPGSYVLVRKYNSVTREWEGGSHSMMINEMTIHRNSFGDVVQVEVTLLQGNAGSPARVTASASLDDLLSYTPAGSRWARGGRKILGFGVDLDEGGSPIYDATRLHYVRDLNILAPPLKKVTVRDPLWDKFYAPLVKELGSYAKKLRDGIRISGPSSIIGRGGVPDGVTTSWLFSRKFLQTQLQGVEIVIDLLDEHPLPLRGAVLSWSGLLPSTFELQWAGNNGKFHSADVPHLEKLNLPRQAKFPIPIPVSFGRQSVSVCYLKLIVPSDAMPGDARLDELRLLYDWGPGKDAEYNPG